MLRPKLSRQTGEMFLQLKLLWLDVVSLSRSTFISSLRHRNNYKLNLWTDAGLFCSPASEMYDWLLMCQKCVNICTGFVFLDLEIKVFPLFWTFMSSQVQFSWCLDMSGALNCVSGYVNWPFDTSVCGQMATVGHHSRMISDLECGWACSSETSNSIWSLLSVYLISFQHPCRSAFAGWSRWLREVWCQTWSFKSALF